jgi:hypothetical protein
MNSERTDTPQRPSGAAFARALTAPARRVRLLSLAAALLAVAIFSCAPALAVSRRGHEYASTFAAPGFGDGQLSDPGDIALSETGATSGDLYVLDRANDRIEQFGPGGQFISAWGWGVNLHGSKGSYEVCTSECHAGADHRGFQLAGAQAIAVDDCNHDGTPCTEAEDPSVGDVYVLAPREHEEEAYEALEKYSPEGRPLERATKFVYQEHGETEKLEEPEAEETHGLTVDPQGTPWLYYEETLYPLDNTTLKSPAALQPLTFTLTGEPATGLAVDAQGDFYLAHTLAGNAARITAVSKWSTIENEAHESELQEISEEVDREDTSGLAVDPHTGVLYLDNLTSVSAFQQNGTLIQSFGSQASEPKASEHLKDGSGIAVDARTREVYVADAAAGHVDVYRPEAPAPPTIEGLSVQEVSPEAAQLDATIDPRGAKGNTSYHFLYGTAPCTSPGACTEVPGGQLGGETFGDEGFGEQEVAVRLGTGTPFPLSAATTYHYRVLASNELGETQSAHEGAFSTPPQTGPFIADARLWEMVSPPEKDGALIEALTKAGGVIQASSGGGAITYVSSTPIGQAAGNRSFEPTQMLSTRGPGGWESQDMTTPNEHGSGLEVEHGAEYRFFSSDLSLALLEPFPALGPMAEPPLSPPITSSEKAPCPGSEKPATCQENTIYLRADAPIAPAPAPPEASQGERKLAEAQQAIYAEAQRNAGEMHDPGYVALVSDANVLEGAQFGPQVRPGADELTQTLSFRDATPDLSHLVISSKAPLTPESETPPSPGAEDLYEWSAGRLTLLNVLPHSEVLAGEPWLGGEHSQDVRNAISDDGSRVFWTGQNGSGEDHLYVRDTAVEPEQTIQLDQVSPGASGEGTPDAVFQTASADGSRVFFTDTQPLTKDSGAGEGRPDLYVCELSEDQGTHVLEECTEENGRLTDLTPAYETQAHEREVADLQGVLLGSSENGSYVYFIANGVLSGPAEAAGAAPGRCRRLHFEEPSSPGASCDLYSEHYDSHSGHEGWGPPLLVAVLSNEDEPDWAAPTETQLGPGELGHLTSRVSPNGLHLAFMSQRSLTGAKGRPYDNDVTAQGADNAPAEEVYEYAAPTAAQEEQGQPGSLICASCEPSGARPVGVLDPFEEGAPGPEGFGLLVDRPRSWAGKWLAGSIPGWTRLAEGVDTPQALHQPDYLSDSGRLFFDSPEALVPQDVNGREDVYEYEPEGVPRGRHECTSASPTFAAASGGCVGLISSGTSERESAFLDASETGGEGPNGEQLSEGGGDVFFLTSAPLSPQDIDSEFDVYDAHECTGASPCIVPPEETPPNDCRSTDECRALTPPSSSLGTSATARAGAAGNLTPQRAVLPSKSTEKPKPKPLTRAQKLAKALKVCAKDKNRRKRLACEKQARKRYGPVNKKARKSDARTARGRGGSR